MSRAHDDANGVARALERIGRLPAVGLFVVTLVGLPVLGLAGVVAADLVPDRLIMNRLVAATQAGLIVEDDYPPGLAGGKLDRHSECKRMTIGLGDPPGVGTVESAIRSPTLGSCSVAVPKVTGWARGDGLVRSYEYSRYWNGSVVLLRPAILFFGVAGTRIVASVVLVACAVAAWRGVVGRLGLAAGLAGTGLLVGTTDLIDLPGMLLHAIGWAVILASVAIVIRLPADVPRLLVVWLMFVLGAIFLYFGDMANPDAAGVLIVGAAGLGILRVANWWSIAERMGLGLVAWIVGFTWMWASKWVLGALVYGFDGMRDNVSGAIEQRLERERDGLSVTAWNNFEAVWREWSKFPLVKEIVIVVAVAAIVLTVRRGRADLVRSGAARLTVAAVVVIPLAWYALARNHTHVHAWFVYRSLVAALTVAAMAWTALPVRSDDARASSGPAVDGVDEGAELGVPPLVEAEGDPQ